MIRRLSTLTTIALLLGLAPVHAGAIGVRCLHPKVFGAAAINVVLLPYLYAGDTPAVGETSAKLSALAQIDTLFSILKYGSVGVVQHLIMSPSEQAECTADIVARKLLGVQSGAEEQLAPGHTAVIVWGRFYEERGQTYVQTYARMIGRDVAVDYVGMTIGDRKFTGRLSATSFAFSPRGVARTELDEMARGVAQALRVYQQPNEDGPSRPIFVGPEDPIVYSVVETQGTWMRIQGQRISGWVRADTPLGEWSLRRKLPEYVFIEAMVGYLASLGNGCCTDTHTRTSAIDAFERTLGEFRDTKARVNAPAPTALAVGLQMLGILQVGTAAPVDMIDRAERVFSDAAVLVPYSADAVNLQLMTRLLLKSKSGPSIADAGAFVQQWSEALSRDPRSADTLDNLQTFLEWVEQDEGTPTPRFTAAPTLDDVRKRLDMTRKIPRARPIGG